MWSRPLRRRRKSWRGEGPSLKPFHKWRVKLDLGGFQGLRVYLARLRRRDFLADLSFWRGLLTTRWFSLFPGSGIGQVLGLGLLAVDSMRCWLSSLTYMCEERPSFPLSLAKVSGVFYLHIKELCSLVKKFAVMWFGYLIHFPLILVVRCGSFLDWTLTSCSRITPLIARMARSLWEGGGCQRTEWLPFLYEAFLPLWWQQSRWTGHVLDTSYHLVYYISNSHPRAC